MSKFDIAGDGIPKEHGRMYMVFHEPVTKNNMGAIGRPYTKNETMGLNITLNYELRDDEIQKLLVIEGVGAVNRTHKYRLWVPIGELFKDTEVTKKVYEVLTKITDDHDKLLDPEKLAPKLKTIGPVQEIPRTVQVEEGLSSIREQRREMINRLLSNQEAPGPVAPIPTSSAPSYDWFETPLDYDNGSEGPR